MSDTTYTPEQLVLLRDAFIRGWRATGEQLANPEVAARLAYPDPKPPLRWRHKEGANWGYAIDGELVRMRYDIVEDRVHGDLNTALIRQLAADSYDTGELVVSEEAVDAMCARIPWMPRDGVSDILRGALPHLLAANQPKLTPNYWIVLDKNSIPYDSYTLYELADKKRACLDKAYHNCAPHRVVAVAEVSDV